MLVDSTQLILSGRVVPVVLRLELWQVVEVLVEREQVLEVLARLPTNMEALVAVEEAALQVALVELAELVAPRAAAAEAVPVARQLEGQEETEAEER